MCRDRATAEQCLQHAWLQSKDPPAQTQEEEEEEVKVTVPEQTSSPERPSPASSSPSRGRGGEGKRGGEEEGDEGPVTEELIVMAAYALGQCRQTDTESMTPDQKAISKRFKFEEPFSALQEIPGDFIY